MLGLSERRHCRSILFLASSLLLLLLSFGESRTARDSTHCLDCYIAGSASRIDGRQRRDEAGMLIMARLNTSLAYQLINYNIIYYNSTCTQTYG